MLVDNDTGTSQDAHRGIAIREGAAHPVQRRWESSYLGICALLQSYLGSIRPGLRTPTGDKGKHPLFADVGSKSTIFLTLEETRGGLDEN
jgi:hypothetical protein